MAERTSDVTQVPFNAMLSALDELHTWRGLIQREKHELLSEDRVSSIACLDRWGRGGLEGEHEQACKLSLESKHMKLNFRFLVID